MDASIGRALGGSALSFLSAPFGIRPTLAPVRSFGAFKTVTVLQKL